MERQGSAEELLAFADAAGQQSGETFIVQENYVHEEAMMTDEDAAGREPLQKLRIAVKTKEDLKYAELLFYTAAELEELMIELQPLFEKFPKSPVTAEEMDKLTASAKE